MGTVNLTTKSQRIAYMDRNAYVARPDRYSKIKADNVIAYASQSSNVPESSLRGALLGVQQAIVYFVVNGHSVNLDKFGKLRPHLRAKSCVTKKQCRKELIKGIYLKYRPSQVLQNLVNKIYLTNTVK